jgi:streptogramin lyase/subtilisin-like proprotein convertase family protein
MRFERTAEGPLRRTAPLAIASMLIGFALLGGTARAATPTVTEFSDGIPAPGQIFGIAAGSDGKLWFADQGSANNTLGSIDPFNLVESEVTSPVVGSGIFGITNGPDGNLYYGQGDSQNSIGGIVPASRAHRFTSLGGSNPAWPRYTAIGPEGNVWTTEPRDPNDTTDTTVPGNINHKDKVSFSTPRIDTAQPDDGTHGPIFAGEVALPAGGTFNGNPEGIAAGPVDTSASPGQALWVTEPVANLIARVLPVFIGGGGEGALVTEYAGLTTAAFPESIALGPDGNIWFTEVGKDKVGRLIPPASSGIGHFDDPPTALDEFPLAPDSHPVGIAAGPDGNLWIAENGSGKIARMTTAGVVTGDFPAPGPSGSLGPSISFSASAPGFITAGADGNMWFGDLFGAVGRITTGLDPPAFRNANPITIPDSVDPSTAATVPVSGLQGSVTDVNIRLTGISHTFPDDLDVILEGPQGQTALIVSDVGSAVGSQTAGPKKSYPADGITLTLDDQAARSIPDGSPLVSGIFKPTNITDALESTTEGNPPGPSSTSFPSALSTFNGSDPNGTWKLWINDDELVDTGKVYGGWGLDIGTTGPPASQQPPPATAPAPTAKKCKKKKRKSAVAAKKCKKRK